MADQQAMLTLFVFIGGLSAATGMVIVETIALSTMVSNSLVLPILLRRRSALADGRDLGRAAILRIRRATIVAVLLLGYAYFRVAGEALALVSIGLISFAAVAQFAPAILGGMYWRSATRRGATWGLLAGFVVWAYTLCRCRRWPDRAGSRERSSRTAPSGWRLLRPTRCSGWTGWTRSATPCCGACWSTWASLWDCP